MDRHLKHGMGVMLQRDASNQRLYAHDVVIEKEPTNTSEDILSTTGSPKSGELHITDIILRALNVKPQYNGAVMTAERMARDGDISYSLRGNTDLQRVNAVLESPF